MLCRFAVQRAASQINITTHTGQKWTCASLRPLLLSHVPREFQTTTGCHFLIFGTIVLGGQNAEPKLSFLFLHLRCLVRTAGTKWKDKHTHIATFSNCVWVLMSTSRIQIQAFPFFMYWGGGVWGCRERGGRKKNTEQNASQWEVKGVQTDHGLI